MSIPFNKKSIFFTAAFALFASAGLIQISHKNQNIFADLLFSSEAGFSLWYVSDRQGDRRWKIPTQVGSVVKLPLGITANGNIASPVPIDSVVFHLIGIPDFLQYSSISTFPGFHVDAVSAAGTNPKTSNVTVYITPEEFTELEKNIPGAPDDQNEIGDLISGTEEILRINFLITKTPYITPPLGVTAILTARDGDFTRYKADGNLRIPGKNSGSIEIDPIFLGDTLQIVSTKQYGFDEVELEFTTSVLAGSGPTASENPANYFIYKCGSHVPAPDSLDSNANDVGACRSKFQDNILDPGEAVAATRNSDAPYLVKIKKNPSVSYQEDAYYIVRVENVSNDTAEISIPPEGIYSQMFQWKGHPGVESVIPVNGNTLFVRFSETVCAASSQGGAEFLASYKILSCDKTVNIPECHEKNQTSGSSLQVSSAEFDGEKTVTLTTGNQVSGFWYVLRVKNIKNSSCAPGSDIPESPAYYAPQFQGFSEPHPSPQSQNSLTIGLSNSPGFHLPWREKMYLHPYGGNAPYFFEVIPANAGTIDVSDPNVAVFVPALVITDNTPIHDGRDIIIRLTDSDGSASSEARQPRRQPASLFG